jgi:hypothetical protein
MELVRSMCLCVDGTFPCRCDPGDRDTVLQAAAEVQILVVCSHAASLPANNELHLSQLPMVTVLLQESPHASPDGSKMRFAVTGFLDFVHRPQF